MTETVQSRNLREAREYMHRHRDDPELKSLAKCEKCGRLWPILLLDTKPWPGYKGEDTEANFDYMEGPCCYGEGYCVP